MLFIDGIAQVFCVLIHAKTCPAKSTFMGIQNRIQYGCRVLGCTKRMRISLVRTRQMSPLGAAI